MECETFIDGFVCDISGIDGCVETHSVTTKSFIERD
jgi:hypothetical protein